jgi:hypothetical protein
MVITSAPPAESAMLCPATFSLPNNNCNEVLTINPDGSVTGAVISINAYDGTEDNLIGVVDNFSGSPVTSLTLTGTAGFFGFDGDGICTFSPNALPPGSGTPASMFSYCSSSQLQGIDPQDYQGPDNTFSNFTSTSSTGQVNFPTPLNNGDTTFFSLELAPNASNPIGGTIGGAPEPATLALFASTGLGLIPFVRRRTARKG